MEIAGVYTDPATRRFGAPFPRPLWACAELLLAGVLILAGLRLQIVLFTFGSAPWLVVIAGLFLWWRKSSPRSLGLGRPTSLPRTIVVGLLVGIGYQIVGTFVMEPAISRLTTGELPDLSGFRSVIGDEMALAYWIGYAWSLAAVVEEIAFRGWILTRMSELGRFSRASWAGALLASSVLFGVVHAYQGIPGVFATGLTGLVFGGVYLATGRNLLVPIVAHGVLDTTGFVMIYLGVYPGV